MSSKEQTNQDLTKPVGFFKGSFGYRMSKKVAELTQVVHMLFTKNHEREIEIDEMKEQFRSEIARMAKLVKSYLDSVEYKVREMERNSKRQVNHVTDNRAQILHEAQERLEACKQDLLEEKMETGRLRDLLTRAHKDNERVKGSHAKLAEQMLDCSRKLDQCLEQLENYKRANRVAEDRVKSVDKYLAEARRELMSREEDLRGAQQQVLRANKMLEDSSRNAEELTRKLQAQEAENSLFRRQAKQGAKKGQKGRPWDAARGRDGDAEACREHLEELERARKEIERLRMEITNREGNFNRVFTKFQPVIVSNENRHRSLGNESELLMVTTTPTGHNRGKKGTLPHIDGLDGEVFNSSPVMSTASGSSLTIPSSAGNRGKKNGHVSPDKATQKFRLIFTNQ